MNNKFKKNISTKYKIPGDMGSPWRITLVGRNNVTYKRAIEDDNKLHSGHTIHYVINHVRGETNISKSILYKAPLQSVISLLSINIDTQITLITFSLSVRLVESFMCNHSVVTYQPLMDKGTLILAYDTRKNNFKPIKDLSDNFHKNIA